MKQLLSALALSALLALCAHLPAGAVTREIAVSRLSGELTVALRTQLKGLGPEDTAIINFDRAGQYAICGTVLAQCNVELKGVGQHRTVLVLDKGSDKGGFTAFTDDAFLEFAGRPGAPIAVSLHDITLALKPHAGCWWSDASRFMVKIMHAGKVNVERVTSRSDNAVCTNFDLRVCSNVTVRGCTLTNHNNCNAGGILWLRGQMENVLIEGNTFNKWGNDEALCFSERTDNAYVTVASIARDITRRNIAVRGNTFNYERGSNESDEWANDVLVAYYTDYASSPYACRSTGVTLSGNTFNLGGPVKTVIGLAFDPADSHSGFVVSDNKIVRQAVTTSQRFYQKDFHVQDRSACRDTLVFCRDTVVNRSWVASPYGDSGYYNFWLSDGGCVAFDQCVFTELNAQAGMHLMKLAASGGEVVLNGNTATRLAGLASVGSENGALSLTATANRFTGDTRLYCDHPARLNLVFTGNTLVSNNMNFFMQQSAQVNSLVFSGNDVTVTQAGARLVQNWGSNGNARFERLEVTGNRFTGIDSNLLLQNITTLKPRKVSANIFQKGA